MESSVDYPGTAQHQALLKALVSRYESDPRILAVIVFGSLGRGTWDAYSDLDCDIVVADDVRIDALHELQSLDESFAALGERIALIVPDDDDAGDVQLESLMQLSIRYHPLAQTSPNIVESMKVLAGRVDHATIAAAGEANRNLANPPPSQLLDACVRYAVYANICLHRDQIWSTVEVLHRMRGLLMEMFAYAHGGERAYQFFQSEADKQVQARLGATLPSYNMAALRESLAKLLDILEDDLGYLTDGQVQLTNMHRAVLNRVRQQSVPAVNQTAATVVP
jgi:predicted nucleotidyltransferase